MIIDTYFPGFVKKAVTFTIADGIVEYDQKLISIVKPAGIKGSFNLINTKLNRNGLTDEEYKALYEDFEVSNHHVFHPLPWFDFDGFQEKDFSKIPVHETINYSDSIKNELDSSYMYKTETNGLYFIDYNYHFYKIYSSKYWHPIMTNDAYVYYVEKTRQDIESIFGKDSVVGFAFPHGKANKYLKDYFKNSGYLYARGAYGKADNDSFSLPNDRYEWSNNAIASNLIELMAKFDSLPDDGNLKFFSFGTHASDFCGKWEILEKFSKDYGNRYDKFYYATVREIFEYEDALKKLIVSDKKIINGSQKNVYIKINGDNLIIAANTQIKI